MNSKFEPNVAEDDIKFTYENCAETFELANCRRRRSLFSNFHPFPFERSHESLARAILSIILLNNKNKLLFLSSFEQRLDTDRRERGRNREQISVTLYRLSVVLLRHNEQVKSHSSQHENFELFYTMRNFSENSGLKLLQFSIALFSLCSLCDTTKSCSCSK